jgi:hypothetical protein
MKSKGHAIFYRQFEESQFDTLQVRLYNQIWKGKNDHTTPVWSWLGCGKLTSTTTMQL